MRSKLVEALQSLLPPGAAFASDETSNIYKLEHGLLGALETFFLNSESLPKELDPSTSVLFIEDFERLLGIIPEPDDTTQTRRTRIKDKLNGDKLLTESLLIERVNSFLDTDDTDYGVSGAVGAKASIKQALSAITLTLQVYITKNYPAECGRIRAGMPLSSYEWQHLNFLDVRITQPSSASLASSASVFSAILSNIQKICDQSLAHEKITARIAYTSLSGNLEYFAFSDGL